jgi:hypothetical protein
MRIHYSHLCEKSFLSQNGNLNLIGIFEKITSHQFPVVFPQLSIVTSLEGEVGKHQLIIKIVNVKNQQEIINPITLNINIDPNKDQPQAKPQNIRLIGDINNLNLKEAGEYEVQLFMNNEKKYSIPFSVQVAVKPIPEGR